MPNNIKDLVKNAHWVNARYSDYWSFLLQSYEGGIDYSNSIITKNANEGVYNQFFKYYVNGVEQTKSTIESNLFMHTKERDDDFRRRLMMSYYYNFCDPIVDIYTNHLFKQPVNVEWAEIESSIEQVRDNIDMQGSSIDEFRMELSIKAQIYGHVFVVIDNPKINGDIVTRLDQIEERAFPYLTIYSPRCVKNWSLDKFGNAYWVLIEESYEGNEDVETFDPKKSIKVYHRLWTREQWFLYNDEHELIEEGYHGLGIVPIVCVFNKKSMKYNNFLGISAIADIAFIARDIYNSSSELRQILRDQTFAFLALQGTSDEYANLDLGTGKGLLYPENRNAPVYVSPPSDNAKTYFEHIDRQISKIYQIAKLEGGGTSQSSVEATVDSQSGVSKAWDFSQTNSALSTKASNLEDGETRIWQIFAMWEGKVWGGSVQYPNDFSITSLMQDLNEAEKLTRLELGDEFMREVKEAIIKKKFPRKSDEDIDKLVKEIESNDKLKNSFGSFAQRVSGVFNNTATGGLNQGARQ